MSKNKLEQITGLENKLIRSTDEEYDKDQKPKRRKIASRRVANIITVGSIVVAVIFGILCTYYWSNSVNVFAEATTEAYSSVKDARVEEICQNYWNQGYADGEYEYHTSNRIAIIIDDVYETANLEVMKVSDVVYIIESGENQAWLKATGTGVYTVNMQAGEYLIDEARQYVLVRVPRPELRINLDQVELMLFENGSRISNGSIGEGEELARRQRAEAKIQLLEDIESNQRFYQDAETAAIALIKSLVRGFNTDIPDLEVDVEFFD